MKSLDLISIVIPVYNEAPNIDELIERCVNACRSIGSPFEIILVNDGSVDGSDAKINLACAQHPGEVVGVMLNRNYGQHSAVLAGLEVSEGAIVVTLDADLQNPPEEIPRLVETMRQGYDVVGSIRVNRNDTIFRRMASMMVNKIVRHYTGQVMSDYGCMLRAYRREIVDALLSCREHSTFIPVLANSIAGKTAEIKVKHDERAKGKSKYDLWKLINLQFDLLTSISTLPLRVLSVLGVIVSIVGVGFGLFLAIMRLIYGAQWAAQGVFTLFAILFVFLGVQFIGMGLLGEYIGRIYHDVRDRPRYFISHVIGKRRP
jgi:undecaprenyl-phosphate 4-deoxy-4-formamido-L-arabinose transferase